MSLRAIDIHNAEIGRVSSRKDQSISFSVETPELPASAKAAFFDLHGKLVRITIFPKDQGEVEIVEVKSEKDHKTVSQRIRAVLYILYKQEYPDSPIPALTNRPISFEEYYERRGEKIIEWLKKQIEDQ